MPPQHDGEKRHHVCSGITLIPARCSWFISAVSLAPGEFCQRYMLSIAAAQLIWTVCNFWSTKGVYPSHATLRPSRDKNNSGVTCRLSLPRCSHSCDDAIRPPVNQLQRAVALQCNSITPFLPRDVLSAKRGIAIACRLSVRAFLMRSDAQNVQW